MTKNSPKLLEISFFIFVYLFLGLTPLAQVHFNAFPLDGFYDEQEIWFSSFIILTGLLGYEIGIFSGNKSEINRGTLKNYSGENFKFLVIVAFACFIIAAQQFGGINNLFLARNDLNSMVTDTMSLVVFLVLLRTPLLIALLFSIIKWKNRTYKSIMIKSNFKLFCLIGLLAVTNLIASNPLASARYWLGTVILSVVFIIIKWNRNTIQLITIAFLAAMLIVFPYSDIFRHSLDSVEVEIADMKTLLTEDGDLDSFQQLLNTLDYRETHGLSYGKQLLGVLLFWVPRSIWSDKPIGSGQMVAEATGYSFTNLSSPLWAEFYINFGLIGVFLLFILYGWITAKLQQGFNMSREMGIVSFYYLFVPVYSAYQLFLIRGELLATFAYLAALMVFILLGLKVVRIRNPGKNRVPRTSINTNE